MRVVVLDVGWEDSFEVAVVEDQEPVEALAADAADPALGEDVRAGCANGCADDPDRFGAEHLVEGGGELAEELLRELRSLVDEVDPCPAEVTTFAKAAPGWRRIDAGLAELLSDSALEPASPALTRSGTVRARSMTFKAGELEIDLSIQDADPGLVLLGQLAPPARASVEVQRDDSSIAATAEADELGRFRIELAEGGRVRLRILRESPAPAVETSWRPSLPGTGKFAMSEGALSLCIDTAGSLLTSEYIAKLPGELRLRWDYRPDALMYCAQPGAVKNALTKFITLGNSRHLGDTCPGIRPEIDWTYEPPTGLLSDSQVADFCTQLGAVCDIPPDYYSGGSTDAKWEFVNFEAKLFTAVVPPGRVEESALVQDSSSECRLSKTDGSIDKRFQPLIVHLPGVCGSYLSSDLFVEINPIASERSALMAQPSGRGDWDNFHIKSGLVPVYVHKELRGRAVSVFPIAYPACNNALAERDDDPCLHFHENGLSETPGTNQTYSRGQTVTLLIAVFHAGEASPNDPTSIINNEGLVGRHLVVWHESDAFSDQYGSPGVRNRVGADVGDRAGRRAAARRSSRCRCRAAEPRDRLRRVARDPLCSSHFHGRRGDHERTSRAPFEPLAGPVKTCRGAVLDGAAGCASSAAR
jgi:hypothetical protein